MSREIEELRRKLFSEKGGKEAVFQAKVVEVDETEFTCQVNYDGVVDYYDVRLRGLVNPDLQGVALIPKIGSTVLVSRINGSNELFVAMFTEIDKIVLTSSDVSFLLDEERIILQKGEEVTVETDANGLIVTTGDAIIQTTTDGITLSKGNNTQVEIKDGKITIKAGDSTLKATTGGMSMVKSGFGLKKTLNDLLTALQSLTVPTGVGPSGIPLNIADFIKIQTELINYLEE